MNRTHLTTPALLATLLCAPLAGQPATGDITPQSWNQWRGPARDGSIPGDHWPDDLAGLERTWRVPLGEGYAGAIVADDRVFVVEAVDNAQEIVRALDRANGEEIWRASWAASGSVPFFAKKRGDWVRATPAYDGEALYVGGIEEVLVKLDGATGEELWRVDFGARFDTGVPDFGFASSPLVDGDALYLQAANSVVKLDRETGDTLWRALEAPGEMMTSGAFSSPVIATLAGAEQLVVQTRYTLHGLSLATGEILWSQEVPNFRGMNILTPVIHGDSVLTSSYRNRTYLYRVARQGDGFTVREVWNNKVHGYMSTPVVIDGHAYLHLGNGRLACIDLETGAERWISKPFGDYWSMVRQGDKVLALDAGGELRLLRANSAAIDVLATREVATQSTWGHLAISGDDIFVRELNGISAFRWNEAAAGTAAGAGN